MPKLGNNLDFNKNEAQNITLHKLAAAPSNPINGQMYYNTVDKKAYIYDGSNWVDMTSQGKIYSGTAPIVVDNSKGTVSITTATKTASGAMSSTDKTNLDGLIDGTKKAKKAENADSADKVKNALTLKGKANNIENSIDFDGSGAKTIEFADGALTCTKNNNTLNVSMPTLLTDVGTDYKHKVKLDSYGRVIGYSNEVDIATTEKLGSVKVGERLSITADGKISANLQSSNDYTTTEKNKLAGIENGAQKNPEHLPQTAGDIISNASFATKNKVSHYGDIFTGSVEINAQSSKVIIDDKATYDKIYNLSLQGTDIYLGYSNGTLNGANWTSTGENATVKIGTYWTLAIKKENSSDGIHYNITVRNDSNTDETVYAVSSTAFPASDVYYDYYYINDDNIKTTSDVVIQIPAAKDCLFWGMCVNYHTAVVSVYPKGSNVSNTDVYYKVKQTSGEGQCIIVHDNGLPLRVSGITAGDNISLEKTETSVKISAAVPNVDNFITSDNIKAGNGIEITKSGKDSTISAKPSKLQFIMAGYSETESSTTAPRAVFVVNDTITINSQQLCVIRLGADDINSIDAQSKVYVKINNELYGISTYKSALLAGSTCVIDDLKTVKTPPRRPDKNGCWEFIGSIGRYTNPNVYQEDGATITEVGDIDIYPTVVNLDDISINGYYYYDVYDDYTEDNKLDLNTLTNEGYYILSGWDYNKVANYPTDMSTQSGMTGNARTVCVLEATSNGSQKLLYRKYNNTVSGGSIVCKTITEHAWYRGRVESTFTNWIYHKEEIKPSDDIERTKGYHYINLEGYSEENKFDFHNYFYSLLATVQNAEEQFGNYVLYYVYPNKTINAPPATIYPGQMLYATWSLNNMATQDASGNYTDGAYVLKVKVGDEWYSCGIINWDDNDGPVWSNWVRVLPTKADIGLGNVTNDAQVKRSEMGVANGVATLDSNAKIKTSQLPDYLLGQLLYGGTVTTGVVATLTDNAKKRLGTNNATITLTNDTSAITGYKANEGIFYIAQANFTFAGISYLIGDWVISNGAGWTKVDNTDSVTSVNGKIGAVVLSAGDVGALPSNTTYVSSVAQGSENGTIAVSVRGGTATNVKVKGLGTAAYKTTGKDTGNVPVIGGNLGQTANVPIVTNASGELVAHSSGALGAAAFKGVDTTPTANSNNLITSGGVKTAIDAIPKGSVTSVGLSMPTGFSVTGSPISTAGTFAVSLSEGYSLMRKKVFDITTSTAVDTGTTATYTLTHNLGTKDVSVTVRETTSGEIILTDIIASTNNAIKVIFSAKPTINYRVVII